MASADSMASYAFPDARSEGRRYLESPHPYRSDFQRDRDRIIHSKAFRRLEKKTQVFGSGYSDHFRNRLTHTIEVTQISRTISSALGLNQDLSEVLALSHDIGHPPFSHEGETVLDELMSSYGLGFEHNLHALTIVEHFEERYPKFLGLNLTFEVREGIVKHSRDYGEGDRPYVDVSDYHLDLRPPLEAQLIDLADEIAYNTADLDDGYESGLLTLDQIAGDSELFGRLLVETKRSHQSVKEKLIFRATLRRLVDTLVTSAIDWTRKRIEGARLNSVDSIRRHPHRLVGLEPTIASLNRAIKGFLRSQLYEHAELRRARDGVRRVIEDLFAFYMGRPERLPGKHRSRLECEPQERVVCNYVAGMTDSFAKGLHERLIVP